MSSLPDTPLVREEVLTFISRSVTFGNLCSFIGSGFSKAVLNNEVDNIALSWGELLKKIAGKLDIDYDSILKEGVGYPDIATMLCQEYSEKESITYDDALRKLKREIADATSWYPDKNKRDEFSRHLETLSPAWIITTNFDLVIESLLTGKAVSLGPNDPLVTPKGVIPVYHLHGIRTNPEGIIITQEDYVSLFRPNEYRQIKLALTIRESTTLLIGYGLGDVNVLTALDWSKNVFSGKQENYPHDVIQILRTNNPKEYPYRDRHGIVILETNDLTCFFSEFKEVRNKLLEEEKKQDEDLKWITNELDNPDQSAIDRFIDNQTYRKKLLSVLSKFPIHLISVFVSFINKCIDETWIRSSPKGAFKGYDQNLNIILDILTTFSINEIPPALFQTTAYAMQRVSAFVGKAPGESWGAYNTWESRKLELSNEIVKELKNIAKLHRYYDLEKLVEGI